MNLPRLRQRIELFTHEIDVYPVSCEALANGRRDVEWLDAVLRGGAKIVQLRDKHCTDRELYQKALVFREKTLLARALFIVNNRLDIALAAKADGVHLGNSDLPAQEARKLAPDMLIGISANTAEQAATAQERGASYFNIGPIYPTATKKGLSNFLGAGKIQEFSSLSPLPFTVMGGIKLEHIQELTSCGARRIAVVTALTQAEDIRGETQKWIREIRTHRQS
jgi:thiamine-phosphate pyrophosphorylase